MTDPAKQATVQQVAKIEQYGAYHLVSYGVWQITVDNAGMIKLPALCTPDSAEDFIGAFMAAVPIARQQKDDNVAAQRQMNDFFEQQRAQRAELHSRAKTVTPRRRDPVKKISRVVPGQRRTSKVGGPRGARQVPAAAKVANPPAKAAVKAPAKAAAKAPAKAAPKRAAQQRGK
jgi:hypothetical protein